MADEQAAAPQDTASVAAGCVKLIVAYDGTRFAGFARQLQAPTVQGELDAALSDLYGRSMMCDGASRTDAGVHAMHQVISYADPGTIPADRVALALRPRLPSDLVAVASQPVSAGFHASRSATHKWYRYRVFVGDVPPPMLAPFVWPLRLSLDIAAMQAAAQQLVGTHDFTSFSAAGDQREDRVRRVRSIAVHECVSTADVVTACGWPPGREVQVDIVGDGFVYKMVRNIIGTLIEVGRGAWSVDSVARIRDAKDRTQAGPTAPPQGLCLMRIWY